ncbi:hypothetical protein C0989_007270 [Termitomyces sp. Mn162]|nr:hypothetical protein C0989_007270 [Termitomyces sp. Mn162]
MNDDPEDILNDSLAFLGGQPVIDDSFVYYGPLTLQIAQKANTLLADHLFSPALYLAERIERGLFPVQSGSTAIELGAGTGLPSLLLATTPNHPALAVVTDYPDENILGNLKKNLENNRPNFQPACRVECTGYEWGTDAGSLLRILLKVSVQKAGKYTRRNVCEDFLRKGREAGLIFDEIFTGPEEAGWKGTMKVRGLDQEALAVRKANCYYWVGRWANV